MNGLSKRLDALEGGEANISPELKKWLGDPLTDAERRSLAVEAAEPSEAVEP